MEENNQEEKIKKLPSWVAVRIGMEILKETREKRYKTKRDNDLLPK